MKKYNKKELLSARFVADGGFFWFRGNLLFRDLVQQSVKHLIVLFNFFVCGRKLFTASFRQAHATELEIMLMVRTGFPMTGFLEKTGYTPDNPDNDLRYHNDIEYDPYNIRDIHADTSF